MVLTAQDNPATFFEFGPHLTTTTVQQVVQVFS